jgi:hypothetical protein
VIVYVPRLAKILLNCGIHLFSSTHVSLETNEQEKGSCWCSQLTQEKEARNNVVLEQLIPSLLVLGLAR